MRKEIMKVIVLVFWLCVMLINVTKFVRTADLQEWENFKTEFRKHYTTSKEEKRRMKIFKANLGKIAKHNEMFKKGKVSYEMGMNQFGDMTEEEFEDMQRSQIALSDDLEETTRSLQGTGSIVTSLPTNSGTIPDFKNWVIEGAVTPVKNQNLNVKCGSCWAFAVTGAIESHNFIHTGKLVALSEQNLLDCVGKYFKMSSHSCKGGTTRYPFQYVIDNQGIATEESYPYTAKQGSCRYEDGKKGTTIVDYKKLNPGDEELMKSIVGLIGPITALIHTEKNFQFHSNGVYISPECKNSKVNHAVLVVGYGIEDNVPYWLLKNSWGVRSGNNGYFKIRRGTNECNISKQNFYPIF